MVLPKIKFNRESLILVSILVIALAVPLTVILLGIRQELRKGAEVETQGSILINNGDEVTNSRDVALTLVAPTQLPTSPDRGWLKVPQAYAQRVTPTPTPTPGEPTPTPTPTPTIDPNADYGCTLECTPNQPIENLAHCEATVTTDELYSGQCSATWDEEALPVGPNYCSAGITQKICPEGQPAHSETHTASITFGRIGTRANEPTKWVTCSDEFTIECPDHRVCKIIEASSRSVQPGGQVTFTSGAFEVDEDAAYAWSDDCGGDFGGQTTREVVWTAPLEETYCEISCSVTDADGMVIECPNTGVDVSAEAPTPTPPESNIEMMVSNYQDFRDGVAGPYVSIKSWTLTEGDGLKTVWAKFREKGGRIWTEPVSDSITLDTGAPEPTPTSPPGTPTPTPACDEPGATLDLLKVKFYQQEYGKKHKGSVLLFLKQGGNVVFERAIQLDENGEAQNVNLPGVEAGTYDVYIREPGYLTQKMGGVVINDTGTTLNFTNPFLPGDFNGDRNVNVLDFSIFRTNYNAWGEEE